MPYTSLQQLLDTLLGFVSVEKDKRRFAMPPGALGWPPVEHLISERFRLADGRWTVADISEPVIEASAVVFSGQMDILLGLTPAFVEVAFDLADGNGDEPSLLVALAPTDSRQPNPIPGWNLGNAFPLWSLLRSPLTKLDLDTPVFYFSSIARRASGPRPAIEAGLDFAAMEVKRTGILEPLSYLPGFKLERFAGAIRGDQAAPHTRLSAAPVPALHVEYLDLPVTFSAVSTDPSENGKIEIPPPPVATYLQLASQVHIGPSEAPPIPIELDFNGLGDVLVFGARLKEISEYGIEAFSGLVHDAPLAAYVARYVPLDTVALERLEVMVSTNPLAVAAIGLGLGTTHSLTVVPGYVEIPDVHVDLLVNDPLSPSITAVLGGRFVFLDGIPVWINAVLPEMVFSGGLETDPPLSLEQIVQAFLPSVHNVPDIWLNQLFVSADLESRRYAFQLAVTSEWAIPIGIARFQLEQASLALGYDANLSSSFSGEIAATAVLLSDSDQEIARFFAEWRLPRDFLIEGRFPEVPLNELADILTGGAIPNAAGVPEIVLRDSLVRFQMSEGAERRRRLTATTSYRFTLETTIEAEGIGAAGIFCEVRRGASSPKAADGATGFVAGLVLKPDWKPDALWGGLAEVFDLLTVKDAGLILSSIEDDQFALPNLNMSYVPAKIQPGVTFFSALELSGDVFEPLRQLFASDVELDLYAYIDTRDLASSEIVASLPGQNGQGAVSFTGLAIAMRPGRGEFSVTAGALFDVYGERLTLEGSGTLILKPPAATFAIRIANWHHPFGIEGLDILTFGLSFTVSAAGVAIGLLGDFLIGSDPAQQFRFAVGGQVLNFEAPSSLLFKLESSVRPLRVTDLVEQYTHLELDEVPLLDEVAFVKLDFYVVTDPAGWKAPDGHFYPQGIGIDAEVIFADEWDVKVFLEAGATRGILADGSVSKPIEILDLLKISDVAGDKGPRVHIDTSGLPPYEVPLPVRLDEQRLRRLRATAKGATAVVSGINPYAVLTAADPAKTYFAFSGAVQLLGLHESFSGSATDGGFEVNFHADLEQLFRANFRASLAKDSGFQGHADGRFDFDLNFPDGVSIDGWPVLPPIVVHGPNAFLTIDAVVGMSEAWVALLLDFHWGSFHFNPSFRLDAGQAAQLLGQLWQEIVAWINDHLEEFFDDLLSSAERYIAAIAEGLLWAGQSALEIAQALYYVFGVTSIERMAALLIQAQRLGYTAMVYALMEVFGVSFDDAVAALRRIGDSCAVATNEAVLYTPDQFIERL